ncbi:hypothetical protein AB0F85_16210 [Nocardia fluminea]|uniref:WXG100-like domain-containing protein n=1 Tax=Nocardia fluminea TaxID=134984 RepID=UPI0033D118E1
MEWPEGNEDEMWAMAEDWRTAADGLRGLVDDVDAAKDAAFKAYPQGEGVEDMLKAFEGMARGDQSVTKLAELFDILGDSVYQTGTEIEYTKIMFLSSLGLLALEIAAAWVFPPTAPAVQAAAIGVTRIVARGIFGRVLAAILRHGAKAVITRVLKFVGQHVAIDTALGTLQELGAQQWQVDQGHRKEVDWNQVKAAAVSSAAGGLAAGPFGNFLGKRLGDGMSPWLKGAITGTGAGLVGAGGGMLGQFGYEGATQGWDQAWNNLKTAASDPLMWSAGASNGGLSGLNKAGANSAWSAMKPGLFERPSFSSQIRDAMGPGYDLGTFGQSDGAGGDGSSNRPGGEGENRAGADDEGTGAGGDDGVRAGAGDDTMGGEGSGESRAGAGDDSQSMRPAGSTQSPEGEAQGPTNSEEGRANQQSGEDRQSSAEGGAGVGRQESKPEVQGGESQAGDGSRQDSGGRAEGESPAAQADSGQDTSRAGEAEQADGASVGEGTRTDAQSSGQPVTQANDSPATNRDTVTQAGAPVAAGVAGAGPAATAGPSPAATGQAPVTSQAATPTTGQPAASSAQSPTATTQSTPQQSTPGQQSTPAQGSQPAARPGAPEARAGLTGGLQGGSDIRSGAPEVRTDSPTVDESRMADPQGAAEDSGATSRPDQESRAGVGEQRGAGMAETPPRGLHAAPGEAPPTRAGEPEATADRTRAGDSEVRPESDPLADIAPVVPIVGVDPGASPARPGAETSRPGRPGTDDATSPRDRTDSGDDRRQPQPDDNDSGPVYDTRIPNGQGVVHHPTGTAIGEDARTHRVSENVRNDGSHDVVVHGRRDGSVTPSNGDPVHPRDIVDVIRSNPNYVPGTPIRLLSCHAGNSKGWAQYIADQLGVEVTAPTDRVGVRREPGSDPVIDRGGKWRTFSPESATTPSDTSSPRTDSDPSDTRDRGSLDGDGPPLDRDLVDFMSDQDDPPTRPAAMSFLEPGTGTANAPFSRTPSVDAHLLGVLDPNNPSVRTAGDPPRITHVGGEPIDEFSHRLSAERGQAFVDASTPDAALVADYEQHKAQQKALETAKSDKGRAVRDAAKALKDARAAHTRAVEAAADARNRGAEDADALDRAAEEAADGVQRAEAGVADAKEQAAAAKTALDNFLAADAAEAEAGNSPAKRLEKAEADRLPGKRRGHVTSITIDRLTGRVYEAANGTSEQRIHPSELHPTLHDNVARYQDPDDAYRNGRDPAHFPHTDNPLGHAEVRGTNAALHDRELLNQQRGPDDQLPTDFDGLASILNSPFVPSRGVEAPCCANCTRVVQGTESTAGHIIDEGAPRVDPLRHADLEQAARDGNPIEPRLVSPEYPETDFMGDDDDVAGPDRGTDDSVPPGMLRGDDGLLHRPGDRPDSYREADGTWHHVDDPANTFRDKIFRLQNDSGGFYRGDDDPLAGADYEYKVQKGSADSHTMRDPGRADELKKASGERLELQTQRDKQRVKLDRLMAEFGVTARNDLAPDKVAGKIADLTAAVDNDATLSQAEKEAKAAKLMALESTANKYFKQGVKMVALSKLLGETAGRDYALSRRGSILLTPFIGAFDGAGVVDYASIVPPTRPGDPPTLLVVEAKGVGATLGGSKIARAEQGSPEYLRRTLDMDQNLRRVLNETPEQMRARGIDPDSPEGRAFRRAVAELLAAREDGTLKVEYKLVHASAKGEVTVTDLRLVRDGVDVLADVPLPVDAATLDRLAADDSIDYMGDEDRTHNREPNFADPEPETPQREVRIELGDNGEVVALHIQLADGQWVVARNDGDEATQDVPARNDAEIREVDNRNALRKLVDDLNAGYQGLNLKYPSGSGLDHRGQTAIRDGVAGGAHLISDPAPAPVQPAPPPVDGPTISEPPPGAGDPALNVARIGREGLTWYHNREHIPVIGGLLGREADSAGDYRPVYYPDGTEYRPWISDADPNAVRDTVLSELRANRMDSDEVRDILKELFADARDPQLRQDLIDDLEFNGLIDTDEARAMEDSPIPPADTQPEQQGPPPEGETLTEMADRLGIHLRGDGPAEIRRAIDQQTHRVLREIGAVEGLADAARRAEEEQTRPYRRADHPADAEPVAAPDERTLPESQRPREVEPRDDTADYDDLDDEVDGKQSPRSHWGDTSSPRPVPFSNEVSFLDKDPLGRFLRDLIVAFEGETSLRDYDRVGNGADRLPEWASFSDDREPGRDEARAREFFEHALRRDQLRDELSGWAAMFGRDLSDLSGDRMDPTLNELRDAVRQRAQNLADFIAAAQPILQGDGAEPVGRTYGDQVARVPDADGGPDRLLVVDGALDREEALARALRDNPELAIDIDNGVLRPDFRAVHADGAGRQFLDPVATPEVQHIRRTVDGAELQVTMMRGEDGQWRPVQPTPEPPPTPRDRADTVREIVDLARQLNLGPAALHPDNIDATIRALHLDNAVRAGQAEALSDYARTMADIESFYLIGDARDQLSSRLGIPEGELTPRRIAEALTDPKQRRGKRQQQFEDLLDGQQRDPVKTAGYSQQLRNVDKAAVTAAQEALITALTPGNPEALRPKVSKTDPLTGRSKVGPADTGIDPAKLRKLVTRMHRLGAGDHARAALAAYADALLRIDPYTDHPAGTRAADPRTTGDPHIYDRDAIHGLRDVVDAAQPGASPADFAAQVADNVARSYGADEPARPNDARPQPNRDWARLVGVDVSTADGAKFVEIYEAYRDGKIEKHEGLSPEELAAEIAAIREEIRLRTEQLEQLKALTDEFYRSVADLPPAEGAPAREHPGARPGALPEGRRGLPTGPDSGEPGGGPRPIGPPPDSGRPESEVPSERGRDLDDRADAKLDQTMRKLDEVADELAEPIPTLDDLVGPGESVDPLAMIDDAVERQNKLHDQADERRADRADAALDDTLRDLDAADADLAALESYLRAQRDFDAAQAEIAARFEELAARDAEVAARRGDDSATDFAVRAADLAALESYLAAQQQFDALRAELAEAARIRPEELDAEALADAQALESYLRAQQEFDAARAEMAARFAAAVERQGSASTQDSGDGSPGESVNGSRAESSSREDEGSRDDYGSRDDDDDSGDPPAAQTAPGGPPSKPPSRPPTAPSPEPEEPAKSSSPLDFGLPRTPAELAVLGDVAQDHSVTDGADAGDGAERAYQRRDVLNDVHQFLQELSDLPPSATADTPPLTPEQADQVRVLAEALGLGDALTGQRDPLGALAEIADMARARGFLDSALDPDAELGKPMRYPDDYEPLDVDELSDGLDQWRVEGDPQVRAEMAEELRLAGLDDARPSLGTEPEPNPQATPLHPSSILPPEDGTRQPGGPRIEPAQQAMDRLAARFGVDLTDAGSLDAARYRQLLRAGAVEAFAAAVRHAEAATDPQQRALREAVARRWASRLGLPADPGLARAADDINRLRAGVTRDAADMAHLYQMVRTELDDRVLSLDVDGDKILVRLVADGPDTWHLEPLARIEPTPFTPTADKAVEVPAKKNWLRKLWDRLVNRGYYGDNPKYPSGSSIDGAGQSMLGHSAGLPLTTTKDSTPNAPGGEYDQLQIKFNPARILKEGVLMWQNRELVPILKHLSSRIADQAGEFLPLRNLDGSEYKPWISDADPELRRQIEQDLRDAGLEHLLEPESLTPAELAAAEPKEISDSDEPVRISSKGEEVPAVAEPLPPWLRDVVDAVNGRIADATVLEALARELGVQLTDFSEDGLRKAVAEAEYRLLRRDGVIQALEAAARFFNAEHADIPFRPANFHSKDPLGAYLKEVVAARGDEFGLRMLNWRGVNNGGEWVNIWGDLSDDGGDPTVHAEDARKIFDDALRRAGLRDERSTWAHLAGADLEALLNNLDAEVARLRAQLDDNVGVLGEFTRRVADFGDSDSGDRLVVDTENGKIAIVDTGAGHETALARALADADADFIDRLNRGEVDIEIRVVGIDGDGRVHILETDAPEVRHLRTEVDGHTVDATMVRDGTQPWRLIERPATGAEPGLPAVVDDTNQSVPEPRSLAELRADIAEVAQRLGIDDPSNLPGEQLDTLLAEQERANQVRARQVEGLVDYARSADAIDNFNALHNARSALALRFGVTPEALSPEVIARGLADPTTRVELHRQRSANLTDYAKLLRGLDPAAVDAARDALAPHLGLPRGALPLDAAALAEALSNRVARGEIDDLVGPLADYVRALAKIDPYAEDLVYDPDTDPRAIGEDPPVHVRDALDFLREVGADDLGNRSPLPAAPEDAVPGPSRDHARLLGVDLTDADDKRVAQVYEWFRDGRIDKHERLTLEQLAQVHEEIRNEIRQRAADIARLRELLNEPFVTDPEIGGADRPALDGGPSERTGSDPAGTSTPGPGLPASGAPVRPGLPAGPGDNGTPLGDSNRTPPENASGTPSEEAGMPRPPAALETAASGDEPTNARSNGAEGARDGDDGSRGDDDESGDPPAPSPAPGGPPSKPPAHPPTALGPEPEEPSKSSSPLDSGLPKAPADLALPGDTDLARPDSDATADAPTRAEQRSDLIDDVRRFLQDLADLPPSTHADASPLTPQQAEQVRRLAEALGLGDALTGQRDPLGALAEIADMARARGFLDSALDPDAALGAPMRYPDDYGPLDLDQLQDGLEHWRVEGDPATRAEIADDLRRAGLDDASRPGLGAEPEPDPQAQPLRPSAVLSPDDGAQPGAPRMEPAQQALDRLAARFGVDLTDPGSLDAARYRQLLRAGAVEAFASAVRHAEAATDPRQRAVRETVARRWGARLGLPADPGLVRAADDIVRLRASVARDAADLAHLDRLARTELDDRMLSVDVDGDQTVVRRVEDGPDAWHLEPVARPEPAPRAPAGETVRETPKKNWLRRLWDRIANRAFLGENPKYPSGSSLDGAGQSVLGHGAGLPLTSTKDSTPNAPGGEYDQLQIKFNPVRILKEGIEMWRKRELVPILRHLSSRIADQAGEFLPLRNLDGSEYKPWISDADPELRRQIEQELRDAGLEHLLEPESLTPEELAAREAAELPETAERQQLPAEPERSPEPAEPLPPWLREVVDAVNQRIADATVLDALAGELGLRITDFSEAGLRDALAEAEYRLLRRDGVIQALEAAARLFNAEHADIPFRPANFFSKDPLGAYLKEVVAARGEQFSFDMLNWRGVNNGGEWVDLWPDLSDDGGSQTIHAEDARKIFDDALRRAGLRDERSTWAHLAGADLAALVQNLDAEIAKLRDQLDSKIGVLDEFARRTAEFGASDTGDRLVLDSENGTIAIVDTGSGHEAALARALAEADTDFVARLNRGEIDIQIRIVGVDDQGRVRVREVDAPQVRHLRGEMDGRTVDATMVRDGTGPWRMVEVPARHTPAETGLPAVADAVNQAVPEPRSLAQVRGEVAEVAGRLGIDDPSNLSPERLNELLGELDRANQVRARQLEGLVDYALSVDAVDNFNALHNARSALALRLGVDPGDLSPELVADRLADPATRVELHRQRAGDLTGYAKLLRALDPAAVDAALAALAPHLGLPRDGLALNAAALAEALSNRAARGDLDDLTGPLADYVRALAKIDPYADGLVYNPAADPRAIGDDPPVHPRDALDFLREVGADDLSDRSPRPAAPEDAAPGPSRDHARLLGADLTDADDEKVAKVYDWFRDGRIDKHERLTLDKLAAVHEQIRDEIRRQAADIARLRALFNEPFVTDPELGNADTPALDDAPPEAVPASDPDVSPTPGPALPGTPLRPELSAGPATNGDNETPSADRSGDQPSAENPELGDPNRPHPRVNGQHPDAQNESSSTPIILDPVTDPGDPGVPNGLQSGRPAHLPAAEPDGSSEPGHGSPRHAVDPGDGSVRRPSGDPDSGVDSSKSDESDTDPDKGFDPDGSGVPPRSPEGDRAGGRRELPGSALRSHIPHPPHEYEVELEVPVFDAVEWPVPPLALTPEPSEPPRPPLPPSPPDRPNPPLPPSPPDRPNPPCPPDIPESPDQPRLPVPPQPTVPPLPPVPPQPPVPTEPPVPSLPPRPPVPPLPSEPTPPYPVPPEPSPHEPTVPSWPVQPTPPGGLPSLPPLPPWGTQPPGSGLPYPPVSGEPFPPGNGQPYPPGNGQSYPPGNGHGQSFPPGNGEPFRPGSGQSSPPGNGEPFRPGGGQSFPPVGGQPFSPGNGQPFPPGNGDPYPGSGQPYAPGSGQSFPPGNSQPYFPGTGNPAIDHSGSQQPGAGNPQGGAPMYPPPVTPPGGGQGDARRPYRPEYQPPTERIVLLVRPYGGGVPAEFDPRSGALRPAAPGQLGADGLYADLGGVTVIFYRLADRLMVQVGAQPIELTGAAHVGWERSRQRMTRFTVAVDGRPMGELIYRSLPPEVDLGLLIRNVVADPAGRMTIFSDRV